MKHQFYNTGRTKARVVRDAHAPEEIFVETVIDDDAQLERNAKIRNEELLPSGTRNPLIDGDVIAYAFSFPTHANYELVCREEPELMHRMQHGNEDERYRAAQRLAVLYPQYVITHHNRRLR